MRFHTLQFVTMDVPDSIASPRFGLNAHIWAHPEGLAVAEPVPTGQVSARRQALHQTLVSHEREAPLGACGDNQPL